MKNFTTVIKHFLTKVQRVLTATIAVFLISAISVAGQTTVVDVIVNSESHTTLEAAVVAAGLVNTLSGDGPFTVFAPTDAAFAALPAGTLDALLADPSGKLTDILKYHVVSGKVLSTDLKDGMNATTLLGKNVKVTINDQGVFINGAKVTVADIMADNGVVHVIDAVLVPETTTSVNNLIDGQQMVMIYPNPVSTTLIIDLVGNKDLVKETNVQITRMNGQIVASIPVKESRISHNVSNLSPGMYLVIVKQNNQVYTEKLIVR